VNAGIMLQQACFAGGPVVADHSGCHKGHDAGIQNPARAVSSPSGLPRSSPLHCITTNAQSGSQPPSNVSHATPPSTAPHMAHRYNSNCASSGPRTAPPSLANRPAPPPGQHTTAQQAPAGLTSALPSESGGCKPLPLRQAASAATQPSHAGHTESATCQPQQRQLHSPFPGQAASGCTTGGSGPSTGQHMRHANGSSAPSTAEPDPAHRTGHRGVEKVLLDSLYPLRDLLPGVEPPTAPDTAHTRHSPNVRAQHCDSVGGVDAEDTGHRDSCRRWHQQRQMPTSHPRCNTCSGYRTS
jgi:hypothetical protein